MMMMRGVSELRLMNTTTSKRTRFYLLLSVLLITTGTAHAAILPSDDPNYEIMAAGRNHAAYFSQFDTNGFTYTISGHSFSFLPRDLSYTDDSGSTTLLLGRSHFTQLKNTTDYIYFDNPYGLENQLQYLCNPLMVKEVYVMNSLPSPENPDDWLTMSSIAVFDTDLKMYYMDENGDEKSWDGTKLRTDEIIFYDAADNFMFKFPRPIAMDALNTVTSGHYLIHENEGILYISSRFSYHSLENMTLPIYLDLSLAEGEVAFGQPEYLIGDTLDVWARGSAWSNERTLLYDPSGTNVITWNIPNYADGWFTSKYTHTSNEVGTWKAEIQTKSWLFGKWEVQDTAYTEVIQQSTDPDPTDPTGTLYGYIKSSSGESLTNVILDIDTGESTSTGSNNQYTLDVPEGQHDVTASRTGYISQTKTVNVQKDISTRLDFELVPKIPPTSEKGVLYGDITSTTGERIKYITVTVDTGESRSTENGNDYVMRASVGWHYVTASLDGYHSQTLYVYIKSGGSFTQLDFTLEPKAKPLPDLSITSADISFEKVI